MHFSKQDNYLPIGMPSLDESGKGRELFTTLVEEKSVVCYSHIIVFFIYNFKYYICVATRGIVQKYWKEIEFEE